MSTARHRARPSRQAYADIAWLVVASSPLVFLVALAVGRLT